MLVITKNTSAQWRLGNWCQQHRLAVLPRTLDGALAEGDPRGWSVIADPGFPALIRGVQAFTLRHDRGRRPRLVFVGTQRALADQADLRGFEQLSSVAWVTHVAWPSRALELRALLEQDGAPAPDALSAAAAHELVTPLATLRGWSELLTRAQPDELGERTRTALPILRRSVSQLERVVADLRDAERLRTGALSLEFTDVDLNSIASMAAESLMPVAADRGISLVSVSCPSAPRVRGDETRLLQVLHNLLANSLKFTPAGGRVDVSVTTDDGSALVAVRDTGKGLTDRELEQLFTRSTDDGPRALHSGLGLMIAREIVERHQGQMQARSGGVNRGTLMIVRLPAARPDR